MVAGDSRIGTASPSGARSPILEQMAPALTMTQLRQARMSSMLLDVAVDRTPLSVARWFGAMQAQDVASGHWSLGARCTGLTQSDVTGAFERAEIVRTWPMRGTIHIIPAEDLQWMLALTGSRTLTGAERRRESLGLTLRDATTAVDALAVELRATPVLTRSEALACIADAGIDVTGQRGYHLLWYAAQHGVTCIGPQRGTDQTFVAVAEWAPDQVSMTRDEALAELLLRYVRSHGPVSLRDFAGWTGLTMTDAKRAATGNDGRLISLALLGQELWATVELAERLRNGDGFGHEPVALPGFDEFILGYKDRSVQVPDGAMERIVPGGNGVFRATVVIDGLVVAIWKRTLTGTRVTVEIEPLARLTKTMRAKVDASFAPYAAFLRRDLVVRESRATALGT